MRYVANPVEADAFKIIAVGGSGAHGTALQLEDHNYVTATPEMTARMTPKVGDYWVIQEDGYIYLNPKDVFERKYRPKNP